MKSKSRDQSPESSAVAAVYDRRPVAPLRVLRGSVRENPSPLRLSRRRAFAGDAFLPSNFQKPLSTNGGLKTACGVLGNTPHAPLSRGPSLYSAGPLHGGMGPRCPFENEDFVAYVR
jgi:hypothetical protein